MNRIVCNVQCIVNEVKLFSQLPTYTCGVHSIQVPLYKHTEELVFTCQAILTSFSMSFELESSIFTQF